VGPWLSGPEFERTSGVSRERADVLLRRLRAAERAVATAAATAAAAL